MYYRTVERKWKNGWKKLTLRKLSVFQFFQESRIFLSPVIKKNSAYYSVNSLDLLE